MDLPEFVGVIDVISELGVDINMIFDDTIKLDDIVRLDDIVKLDDVEIIESGIKLNRYSVQYNYVCTCHKLSTLLTDYACDKLLQSFGEVIGLHWLIID